MSRKCKQRLRIATEMTVASHEDTVAIIATVPGVGRVSIPMTPVEARRAAQALEQASNDAAAHGADSVVAKLQAAGFNQGGGHS